MLTHVAELKPVSSLAKASALEFLFLSLQFSLAYRVNDEPFQPMTYVLDQFANHNSVSTSSLSCDIAIVLLSSAMGPGAAQLAIAAGLGQRTFKMQTAGYPGEADQAC